MGLNFSFGRGRVDGDVDDGIGREVWWVRKAG